MPLLDIICIAPSCCWVVSLKRGTLLIAYSVLFPLSILIILLIVVSLETQQEDDDLVLKVGRVGVYLLYAPIMLLAVASLLLIIGIYKPSPWLVELYVWQMLFHSCLMLLYFIFVIAYGLSKDYRVFSMSMFIITMLYLTFCYHFFIVVNSYRIKMIGT